MPYRDPEKRREASRKAAAKYYAKKSVESEEFRQAARDRIAAWRAASPENKQRATQKSKEWHREFKARDPEGYHEYESERGRRWRFKIKAEMVAAYGGKCVCCGETRFEFLTINHKHGGGRQHRLSLKGNARVGGVNFYFWLRKQGWPQEDYDLHCFNCNCAKGFLGYCPHEREREAAMVSSNCEIYSVVRPEN